MRDINSLYITSLTSAYKSFEPFIFFLVHRNISRTAFMGPRKSEGIYMVDPLANKTNVKKPNQPVKLLSVEGLKKALRFLSCSSFFLSSTI